MNRAPPPQPSDLPPASTVGPGQAADVSLPPPQIEGYEILGELAAAGQGRVWKARQLSTHREVALKVPRVDLLRSRAALTRFEREVELAARLNHPNIARIYDSGVHQGLYYYAMELIDGVWLDAYAKEHSLSLSQILALMQAICNAIQHAHQNGVIHRDLKPSNILVTQDGQPHIVDFGLAVTITREDTTGTTSVDGEVTGTPAYMSPEQAAGLREHLDTRTDVYSLGVVFYRLVTGSFPYDVSTSVLQTLQNIREHEPIRPSRIARHLDRDTEAIILKALEKEPDQRYQSVAEFKTNIERRLAGLPVFIRSASWLYVLRKTITRHKRTCTVAALLVVIVSALLCFSLQLIAQLRQTQQDLVQQKELFVQQSADLRHLAKTTVLAEFLGAWHEGDRRSAALFAAGFADGTSEAIAARFLLDRRPLADKMEEFKQNLKAAEPGFVEFILAEHYLKDGDRRQAISFYQACLSRQGPEPKNPWLANSAQSRLNELTTGTQSAGVTAESEIKTP